MAVAVRETTHRQDDDAGRRHAVSLLDATLETTADGIVVVSNTGQITGVNEQYLRLWGMPREILAEDDAYALVKFIAKQLVDPDSFKAKVAELYANHELHSQDLWSSRTAAPWNCIRARKRSRTRWWPDLELPRRHYAHHGTGPGPPRPRRAGPAGGTSSKPWPSRTR